MLEILAACPVYACSKVKQRSTEGFWGQLDPMRMAFKKDLFGSSVWHRLEDKEWNCSQIVS